MRSHGDIRGFGWFLAGITLVLGGLACGPHVNADPDLTGTQNGTTTATSTSTSTGNSSANATETSAGSTAPGSSSIGSSEGEGTSGDFIVVPDGGVVCFVSAEPLGYPHCDCGIWDQDCADGYKCAPWANDGGTHWNATRCSPLDPQAGAVGEACDVETHPASGLDSCGADAVCFGVDPLTLEGTCVAHCTGSETAPECPEDTACALDNDGVLILCLPTCDPLADACAPGTTCRPASDSADEFFCFPFDPSSPADDHCELEGSCGPAQLCDPPASASDCPEGASCCTTWCDLADPAAADLLCDGLQPGDVCLPYLVDELPVPGFDTLGVCGSVP